MYRGGCARLSGIGRLSNLGGEVNEVKLFSVDFSHKPVNFPRLLSNVLAVMDLTLAKFENADGDSDNDRSAAGGIFDDDNGSVLVILFFSERSKLSTISRRLCKTWFTGSPE